MDTDATTPDAGRSSTGEDDFRIVDVAPDEGFRCPSITYHFNGRDHTGLDAIIYKRSKEAGRYYLPPVDREAIMKAGKEYREEHKLLPWPEIGDPIPKAERRELKKRDKDILKDPEQLHEAPRPAVAARTEDKPTPPPSQVLRPVSGNVYADPGSGSAMIDIWSNGEIVSYLAHHIESEMEKHPEMYSQELRDKVNEGIWKVASGIKDTPETTDHLEGSEATLTPMAVQVRRKDKAQIKELGPGELFLEEDGTPGYATIYNGYIQVRNSREWEDYEPGSAEKIVKMAEDIGGFFNLPGRPDVESEDPELLTDIIQAVHPIVEFPGRSDLPEERDDDEDSRYEPVFASWLVGSYLKEAFGVNPRWGMAGTSNSGKGRAQKAVSLLGHHALTIGSPTPAVMFRLSDWYGCTLTLDEIQDAAKNPEKMADILDILKLGFDKTPVCRVGGENKTIDRFGTDSYVLYSVKTWTPPEDIINRSIYVTMTKHRRPVMEDTPLDGPEFQDLRGRLAALRLKAMAGKLDIEGAKERARAIIKEPITLDGRTYKLDDRSAEIGRVLIACCILAGGKGEDIEDIRQVLMSSVLEASEAMCETIEGRTFFALQAVMEQYKRERGKSFSPHQISTVDVREQLNNDLAQTGNAGKWEVKTMTVTLALKALGFKIRTGAHNKSYLQNASFAKVYALNMEKIGARPEDA